MTLLQPDGLWLLGLIPVIVLIHLLQANRYRQVVPGAFLWRGLDLELSASRRWRPPRLTVLLVLQILAIAALAIAIASPRMTAPPRRHLFVLLDGSASMLATDVAPTRFDESVRRARDLLDGLGLQDRATLIRVGPSPRVLADDVDPSVARSALAGVQAGAGSAAMREALFLASSLAGRVTDATTEAVVLTDGAFADPGDLSGLTTPTRFQQIGGDAENYAITELNVRPYPQPAAGLAAFVRVVNYTDRPATMPIRLLADGLLQETRDVEVAARRRSDLTFHVPSGTRRVAVVLGGRDALAADDLAEVAVEGGYARDVLLVSRLPDVLQRALRAIPDLRVQTVAPENYTGAGAELVVLDGVLPERLPSGQLLIFNPPAGRAYLTVRGEPRQAQVTRYDAHHPLLRSVDLSANRLARATAVEPPSWARVVADVGGDPIVVEGREAGRAVVVFGFDPNGSGLDRQLAFPLLVANAVSYVAGGELTPSLAPGRAVSLPVTPGIREVRLDSPGGAPRSLSVEGSSVTLERLELPGQYTVREGSSASRGEVGDVGRVFSVNVVNEAESNPRARSWPPVEVAMPRSEQPSLTSLELWPYLLGLGLLLLGAEWARFGRGRAA